MELVSLTYTSWAKAGLTDGDVDSILGQSRVNNPLDGVTGLLVFNGGAFVQLIEGGERAIDDLVERLRHDPRHSEFRIRDRRTIARRSFPDWSMGMLRLASGSFEGREAVDRGLERDLPPAVRNLIQAALTSLSGEGR